MTAIKPSLIVINAEIHFPDCDNVGICKNDFDGLSNFRKKRTFKG